MKILQLRFKNLNSLTGEWFIDFTAPGYLSDGIFAITGPTGSGKSTILDAICLAIYGHTPRLGKITGSTNEIMSRQTGECFSEVVFRANETDYRCHWSQQRARKKANGKLQEPQHEISESESGVILAEKLTEVNAVVVKKTGMNYKQFTQSMLLAQGSFAVFLQATPAERAPILEQITGTDIYSEISKHVFEKQRVERGLLEQLKARVKEDVPLSDEEENQLEKGIRESQEQAIILTARKGNLEDSARWLTGIDLLCNELSGIEEEETRHTFALSEFEPLGQRLDRGIKAAAFDGEYATLAEIRKTQNEELEKLGNLEGILPKSEGKLNSLLALKNSSIEALDSANREKNAGLAIIKKVREIDQVISIKTAELKKAQAKLDSTVEEASGETSKKKDIEDSIRLINEEFSAIYDFLLKHQEDTFLLTELAGIKEQTNHLKESLAIFSEAQSKVREAEETLKKRMEEFHSLEDNLDKFEKKVSEASELVSIARKGMKDTLGDRSLPSIRSEIGILYVELAKLQKIADLETERTQLADNVPCPLCGSLHHPWAEENVPGTSETERKLKELSEMAKNAENLEEVLDGYLTQEKEASDKLAELKHHLNLASQNIYNIKESVDERRKIERDSKASVEQKSVNLQKTLTPLGIVKIEGNFHSLDVLYNKLEKQKNDLEKHLKRKGDLEVRINELKNNITRIDARLETLNQDIAGQKDETSQKTTEIGELKKQREEIYGSKDADEEERKINDRVQKATEKKEDAERDFNQCNLEYNTLKNNIEALKGSTEKRSAEIERERAELERSIVLAGFSGEEDFLASRLTGEERKRLELKKRELDSRSADIATRKKDRKDRLRDEKAKAITYSDFAEINSELDKITPELASVNHRTVTLLGRKEANENTKAQNLRLRQNIDNQQSVYNRWNALCDLIGSADGKKFRNYAQGLTFELMVSQANRQLLKLSERYMLVRDEEQPLELNVIDNYQAGEIRTTKNLSGGESFIVSLALALGLSQMSGRNVRVDSLFLDEGFGTLDEDALDMALETLAGLRQEGKLIGVISHVAAMKDRINTRIMVQPVRGGKSTISGPGVTRIM